MLHDFVLNALSYALPVFVLQFLVQPVIAHRLGSDLNGRYLTLMSANYFLISITAAVLGTVRMLQHREYAEKKLAGDFNLFFLADAGVLVVVMPVCYRLVMGPAPAGGMLLYVLIGLLYLYHDYVLAQYRLRLQFGRVAVNNLLLILGYLAGTAAFAKGWIPWQGILLTAYGAGAVYDWSRTTFLKEPLQKTGLFRPTFRKIASLTAANALSAGITYADKLLLYPLLGGESVSVYSTASLAGKLLLLLSAPLNSFLLSRLVQDRSDRPALRRRPLAAGAAVLALAYLLCVAVGGPLAGLLYPQWAAGSRRYIPLTAAAGLLNLAAGLLNTLAVRYCALDLQVAVQAAALVLYVGLELVLVRYGGLMGFAAGAVLAALIKAAALLVCLLRCAKKQEGTSYD